MNVRESQYVGCVVGLAVGDALGFPAEFRSREQIHEEFGAEGITTFIALQDTHFSGPFFTGPDHPPGTFTDDTQMSIAVAEALLDAGHQDIDGLMAAVARRFVEWAGSETNKRAPGATCMTGCASLARGVPWREAGVANSKGCGSAMRVAPIGLYFQDLDDVADVARSSALLTHGHHAALEGAAAAALMVALALRRADAEDIHREIKRRCSGRSSDFDECWNKIPAMVQLAPEVALAQGGLGEGWGAEQAVASAIYCYWRSPNDYAKAVLTAVNTDGDSDSIAAITGSVLGARLGIEAIPDVWSSGVEDAVYLRKLG